MQDLTSVTFIGLITIGVVNVITFFKPDIKSEIKFGISVLVAFGLTFVPPDMGNIILEKARLAISTAFLASGAYKLASKAGGE